MKKKILSAPPWLAPLLLCGCITSALIANAVTSVSEVATSALMQKQTITVAQVSTLATDLNAFAANATPLPATDNSVIANVITKIAANRAANLTETSVVDAANRAIAALTAASSASPSAAQGIAWADLKDVIAGLNQAVGNAQANPNLVPAMGAK